MRLVLALILVALASSIAHAADLDCDARRFSIEKLAQDLAAGRLEPDLANQIKRTPQQSVAGYFLAKAYKGKDAAACDGLKAFDRREPGLDPLESRCRQHYYRLAAVRAYVAGDSRFLSLCRDSRVKGGGRSRKVAELSCRGLERFRRTGIDEGAVARFCSEVAAATDGPPAEDECLGLTHALFGDDRFCGKGPPDKREMCSAFAAFFHAYHARDARLCGASDYCLLMAGEASALIQKRAEQARRLYCLLR